jgi:hypothetical protein
VGNVENDDPEVIAPVEPQSPPEEEPPAQASLF